MRRHLWGHGVGATLFCLGGSVSSAFGVGGSVPRGMAMVPEASFLVGSSFEEIIAATEHCSSLRPNSPCVPEEFAAELTDATPSRVPAFLMDRTEVSIEAYERCVAVGPCRPAAYELGNDAIRAPGFPVVFVSHADADRYCSFRGARLPSEAEFESAARGEARRTYPWGRLFHHSLANTGAFGRQRTSARDGHHLLAPVSSFTRGRTPQGLLHLAGNAAEWTNTPYLPHGSSGSSPLVVVKGGSFSEPPTAVRGAARRGVPRAARSADIGFRCAKSLVEAPPSAATSGPVSDSTSTPVL